MLGTCKFTRSTLLTSVPRFPLEAFIPGVSRQDTTPQPRNGNGQTVGISLYTDEESIGINIYRQTDLVGDSPVGKSFTDGLLLIPMDFTYAVMPMDCA